MLAVWLGMGKEQHVAEAKVHVVRPRASHEREYLSAPSLVCRQQHCGARILVSDHKAPIVGLQGVSRALAWRYCVDAAEAEQYGSR